MASAFCIVKREEEDYAILQHRGDRAGQGDRTGAEPGRETQALQECHDASYTDVFARMDFSATDKFDDLMENMDLGWKLSSSQQAQQT